MPTRSQRHIGQLVVAGFAGVTLPVELRAIDNRRLVRGPLMQVEPRLMSRVGLALLEVLDLAED